MTKRVNNRAGKLGPSPKYNKQLDSERGRAKFNREHPWLNTKPHTGYEKRQGRPGYWRKPKKRAA